VGVDLQQPDFWQASIDLIEEDLGRWEKVVDELALGD
jgi:hypothetical protein